jgi:hypothetical protein
MTTNHRVGNLLAIVIAGCGLVACTTSTAKSDGGGGGGRGGAAGTTGVGGSTGGTTGGGGSGGLAVSNGTACLPVASSGLITDFTYMAPDGGTDGGAMTDQIRFGDDTTVLSGGNYYYPNPSSTSSFKLTGDVTGNNFHISGMVGDYSGFGLYLDGPCDHIDATGFTGLSFTVAAGATNAMNSLTVEIDTLDDTIAASWLMLHPAPDGTDAMVVAGAAGRCLPPSTAGINKYAQSTCTEPTSVVNITGTAAAPQTVSLAFSSFTTGKPAAAVTASDIVAIRFILPNPAGVGTAAPTPYQLDLTIDDLKFVR